MFFSCDQAKNTSVCLSDCLSVRQSVHTSVRPSATPFLQCSSYRIIMKFSRVITIDKCDVHAKGQRSRSQRSWPHLTFSGLQFESTYGNEIKHKAWCCLEEVPYCFSRLSVKSQGHTGQKIADFDPNWTFPGCSSSLTTPMDLKWCTKLDVV